MFLARCVLIFLCLLPIAAYGGALVPPNPNPGAIDFSQPIVDDTGKTALIDPKQESLGVITLKFVSIHALTGLYEDEKNIAPEKKFERGLLAQKISAADGPMKLTAEEIADIKLVIGKAYGPWVIAQAWPMLDPAEKK